MSAELDQLKEKVRIAKIKLKEAIYAAERNGVTRCREKLARLEDELAGHPDFEPEPEPEAEVEDAELESSEEQQDDSETAEGDKEDHEDG
jgi:hypothetical protein